jgi:hypothetical protein
MHEYGSGVRTLGRGELPSLRIRRRIVELTGVLAKQRCAAKPVISEAACHRVLTVPKLTIARQPL